MKRLLCVSALALGALAFTGCGSGGGGGGFLPVNGGNNNGGNPGNPGNPGGGGGSTPLQQMLLLWLMLVPILV